VSISGPGAVACNCVCESVSLLVFLLYSPPCIRAPYPRRPRKRCCPILGSKLVHGTLVRQRAVWGAGHRRADQYYPRGICHQLGSVRSGVAGLRAVARRLCSSCAPIRRCFLNITRAIHTREQTRRSHSTPTCACARLVVPPCQIPCTALAAPLVCSWLTLGVEN
jgi:hypothetical protein